MTIPVNTRVLIFGGLALLLMGLGLGYLAFYSPAKKSVVQQTQSKPLVPDEVVSPGPVFDSGAFRYRVDTIRMYYPCPESENPYPQPQPGESSVFTEVPKGIPGFSLEPTLHMPAFRIHQAAPLMQFGAKVGMDPIQGFWAGSVIGRLSLGDFHVLAEIGLMRDLYFVILAIEVYFYSILRQP